MSTTTTTRGREAGAVAMVARTELRRYLQDRLALFVTVLMPVLLVLLIGSATGSAPQTYPVGVVDGDGTALSADVVTALDRSDAIDTVTYTDERELRRDIRLGMVAAGVVLPSGLAARVSAGRTVDVPVLTVQADQAAPSVVAAVNGAVAAEGGQLAAAAFVSRTLGVPAARARAAVSAVSAGVPAPTVVTSTVGSVRPEDENSFTHAVTSQLTLFVFLNGIIAAAGLVETRRLGVARRALAAPGGARTVVLGMGGSRFLLGLLQAALLLVVGAVAFAVSWGSPLATALVVVVYCLVAAGACMLLGAVARTPEQAVAVAVPVGIGMAMLGGSMWPLDVVGPVMRAVGHLTPQAWANDALDAIVNESAGPAQVAVPLLVLTGYAAVLLVAGMVALRRSVTR